MDMRNALYPVRGQAREKVERPTRLRLPRPAMRGAPGGTRPASPPKPQRRLARENVPWSSAAPSFAGVPSAAPARALSSRSGTGKPANDTMTWTRLLDQAPHRTCFSRCGALARCVQIEHILSLPLHGQNAPEARVRPSPSHLLRTRSGPFARGRSQRHPALCLTALRNAVVLIMRPYALEFCPPSPRLQPRRRPPRERGK